MNMEHFINIAFWIVTLSGCLQAKPIYILDLNIPSMRTRIECPSDSTFYTPPVGKIQEHCITTALDCIMRELKGTVKPECVDPEQYIDQALDFFTDGINERIAGGHAMTDSSECSCEKWPQKNFSEFLNKTVTLLECANSIQK